MKAALKLIGVCVVSVFGLSACAASAPTKSVHEVGGQIQLADSSIGESYDLVLSRATANFGIEPNCETRRISLNKQRKSFMYEICGFSPEKQTFADAPLSEVVYHFIERDLVRIDVRAQGRDALLDSVKADLTTLFAKSKTASDSLGEKSYEWVAQQHIAGVRAGKGANDGNVHVRLLEANLANDAPWLALE